VFNGRQPGNLLTTAVMSMIAVFIQKISSACFRGGLAVLTSFEAS
jgi:hypothetical protein